ncbi:interleukin-13 receptor subunit alpha-1-like [Pristis pectinata]|uniref:interleukin-13 receptor subunit alpha-1-like n=1 Tax=Pristis pectinata TaxID=685728 RepID=UPI00223D4612|nr:interleukin-13 receptor subunit alpha-1-like [Pristis pectinata]
MQAWVPPLFLSLCLPGRLALALPPPLVPHQDCDNSSVDLLPPTNLTVALSGIGFVNYSWLPSDLLNSSKYSFRYESSFRYDGGPWEGRRINANLNRKEIMIRNKGINFKVRALETLKTMENSDPHTCRESNWVDIYIPPEEGDDNTAVTNFSCVYYNFEYVNCTWIIGSMAPPDTIYTFHYWQESMDTIQNCTKYILKNGRHVGCQVQRDQFDDKKDLNSRVAGVSATVKIKPFYHKLDHSAFVKLCPPWGISVMKIPEGHYVTWEIPDDWKPQCLKYEVRIRSSKSSSWTVYQFITRGENITGTDNKSKNTIQVRVKYTICGSSGIWSEWSPEENFGEDIREAWNWSIALLIFIPILMAAIAITFLTNLKKLRKLILPPIPDPGKLLKGVFGDSNGDHSIRNKHLKGSLTLKPEMELTCKVTTVEQMKFPAESERKLIVNEVSEEEEVPMDDDYMQYNLVTS